MFCECGQPVEKSIEGKLLCRNCQTLTQLSANDILVDATIREYEANKQENKRFEDYLRANGIQPDYVDRSSCSVDGIWFDAEKYLGNAIIRKGKQ